MQESAGVSTGTRSSEFMGQRYIFSPASLTESYSFWIGLKVLVPSDTLDDKDRLSLTIKTDDITSSRKDVDPLGQLQVAQGVMG